MAHLRISQSDMFIDPLVMVDRIFQVLQFWGQLDFTTGLTPWIHITHVLERKKSPVNSKQAWMKH